MLNTTEVLEATSQVQGLLLNLQEQVMLKGADENAINALILHFQETVKTALTINPETLKARVPNLIKKLRDANTALLETDPHDFQTWNSRATQIDAIKRLIVKCGGQIPEVY